MADARIRVLARQVTASATPVPTAATGGIVNRRIVVRRVPKGLPTQKDFETVTEELPPLEDGQMLLKTRWLTVDPYMRSIEGMGNPKSVGKTMRGGSVAEVLESRLPDWNAGDLVVGYYGWQDYAIATSKDKQFNTDSVPIEKWDMSLGSPSTALGVLGMTGYTAYFGLLNVGQPNAGETVVVSAASGAVGQVVGQIAKIKGCRVVGIAGGAKKCAFCTEELKFDACIDYKAPDLPGNLKNACPNGVDIYFENVGGDVLEAVIPLLNPSCRVPICGFVSQYNNDDMMSAAPMVRLAESGFKKMKRGGKEGFRFFFWSEPAFVPRRGEALQTMSGWIKEGSLKYRESITEGLDNVVDSFIGMLRGENFGKAIVKIA